MKFASVVLGPDLISRCRNFLANSDKWVSSLLGRMQKRHLKIKRKKEKPGGRTRAWYSWKQISGGARRYYKLMLT